MIAPASPASANAAVPAAISSPTATPLAPLPSMLPALPMTPSSPTPIHAVANAPNVYPKPPANLSAQKLAVPSPANTLAFCSCCV